jgi:hypothetical protein
MLWGLILRFRFVSGSLIQTPRLVSKGPPGPHKNDTKYLEVENSWGTACDHLSQVFYHGEVGAVRRLYCHPLLPDGATAIIPGVLGGRDI